MDKNKPTSHSSKSAQDKELSDMIVSEDEDEESEDEDEIDDDSSEIVAAVPGSMREWDDDVTIKYIDGQISFDELARVMETNDSKDEPQVTPQEAFEKEFTESQYKGRKSKKNVSKETRDKVKEKTARVRRRLPKDLAGLVGEANVRFARGEHDEAVKMYMEVIRLAPTAPEPFQSLGMFYEEIGDMEKAFQLLLIGAYLCPSDGDGWIKLAEMAHELNKLEQAVTCFSKAIRIFPENISLHFQRCQLYEKIGDMKKAIEGYENLMRALKPTEGELALQLAKDIVKIHYNNNEIAPGIKIIEEALEKYHSFVTCEEVNVYLELLISDKQFFKCLLAFQKYCGVKFHILNDECDLSTTTHSNVIKAGNLKVELVYLVLPIDLRAKLIVSLINMKCLESVDDLLQVIVDENPEEIGDIYLDIIDAFMGNKIFDKSNQLLTKLLDTEKFNVVDVWFRYGKSLKKLKNIDDSIIAYSTVVRLAPSHFTARLSLTKLLLHTGKSKEAMEESSTYECDNEVHKELLLIHCKLLYDFKKWESFKEAARVLLLSEIIYLSTQKELSVMISSSSYRTRIDSLKDIHREIEGAEENYRYKFIGKTIRTDDLLEIFIKLCYTLMYKLHDSVELTRIAFSAYTCFPFVEYEDTIDYYALMSCYVSKNITHTYLLIKALLSRDLLNMQIWNLFCPIMMRFYQDLRHNRFCIRLFIKHPEHIALAYFNGHNALMSGSYKHALAEYVCILKQHPNDAFAAFSVALGYLHLACQKFISNRHSIVIQLCAFLDLYLQLRGECQESLYNLGRAFHQLGLLHNAVHFYKKALQCPCDIDTDITASNSNETSVRKYDLQREIVYNLSMIYRNSGSHDLALQLIRKYFVV